MQKLKFFHLCAHSLVNKQVDQTRMQKRCEAKLWSFDGSNYTFIKGIKAFDCHQYAV